MKNIARPFLNSICGLSWCCKRTATTVSSFAKGNLESAPCVIVLVGLPGSGKSTFSGMLNTDTWTVVNQDTLGSRKKCVRMAQTALQAGKRVVIDRTNIDCTQRAHWVHLLQYWPGSDGQAWVVEFQMGADDCISRCEARQGHRTVDSHNAARAVHSAFKAYHEPALSEGFSCFIRLSGDDYSDGHDGGKEREALVSWATKRLNALTHHSLIQEIKKPTRHRGKANTHQELAPTCGVGHMAAVSCVAPDKDADG
jgi:predicted kinase